jgi:serine/threonine protein phosphatase PrpC
MTIVKAIGVAENANLRHRARMEDRYVVANPLVGGPQESCYLAVYDGHGGREVCSTTLASSTT